MKVKRRVFLTTGAVLPALSFGTSSGEGPTTTGPLDSSFDPWVEVHAENMRLNVAEISRRVDARPILAVAKNNGYGLGVVNVARVLEPLNAIAGLAVVKLQEAATLRDSGIRKPILLL